MIGPTSFGTDACAAADSLESLYRGSESPKEETSRIVFRGGFVYPDSRAVYGHLRSITDSESREARWPASGADAVSSSLIRRIICCSVGASAEVVN